MLREIVPDCFGGGSLKMCFVPEILNQMLSITAVIVINHYGRGHKQTTTTTTDNNTDKISKSDNRITFEKFNSINGLTRGKCTSTYSQINLHNFSFVY